MSVEAVVSIGAAWHAHSPALFAFGGDSSIELLSAAVVLWSFRFELNEARAARFAGGLLLMLAGLVALTSVLNFFGYREAQRSFVNRTLAGRCLCHAMACQAETAIGRRDFERGVEGGCSSVRLVRHHGLDRFGRITCQRHMGNWWADPVAALALTPIILREGWIAFTSKRTCCSD